MWARTSLNALCWVAFLVFSPASADTNDNLDTAQIQFLSAKADQVLTDLKQTCEALRLTYVGPPGFVPTWTVTDEPNDLISVSGRTMRIGSLGHQFTFREADGRVTGYLNTLLIDDLPEGKILYDQPIKPKWSNAQAIAIATAFKRVFVVPDDALLGHPIARYDQNSEYVSVGGRLTGEKKYRLGQWMVSWPRVDSKGHPFYGDHVTIQIQEGYAPLGVGVGLTTPYVESKAEPMSETDALARAENIVYWRQFDERIFYHAVWVEDYARNITGDYILSKGLAIVLPNRAPSFWSVFQSKPSTVAGRLAWVVWFRPIHSTKPPASGWYDEDFAVWLDAYSGEVIGGDAML
jgi:hypothetical protein